MRKPKMKTFDMLYSVTRGETYRVQAQNEKEAIDLALQHGELVETGDIVDFTDCGVELKS